MFHVGQKVLCVDGDSTGKYMPVGYIALTRDMHGLQVGSVYTIRDVGCVLGVVACRLEEIRREFDLFLEEESLFAQARFRPIEDRKADISIFTEMLTPTPQRVRETTGSWDGNRARYRPSLHRRRGWRDDRCSLVFGLHAAGQEYPLRAGRFRI